MVDRRKLERLSPLVIRAQFLQGAQLRQGYLTNLSEAGAFLATEEALPLGEPIHVHIALPWGLGEHDAVAATVWRTRDLGNEIEMPAGAGLVFSELSQQTRDGIRRYMQKFYQALARIEDGGLKEALGELSKDSTGPAPQKH